MTGTEKLLAANLLLIAAHHFGHHTCNDFNLKAHIPDWSERNDFMRRYHEFNGDPEEWDPKGQYEIEMDFSIMSFMANELRKEVNG